MGGHEAQSRPRVLVATPDFPPAAGGIQTLLHEVVRRLSRVDVRVLTFATEGWEAFDRTSAIPTTRVRYDPERHRASVLRLNRRTLGLAARWRPAVVLSGHAVMAPSTEAARVLLRRPVVQYTHANEFENRPRVTARAVRGADATIAVSRYTARLCAESGADPARVHIVHPGVELPPPSGAERASRPTLVSLSRLAEAYKGHDVVLRALVEVRRRVPDVEWVVLGDGPLRASLERQAAELGVAGAVRFAGRVSDEERDRALDRAHVFVLPSRTRPSGGGGEGFGIVFLEAAAHGLPVVAGKLGGALDAVADGETGLLVDPADDAAVAEAIASLLLDPGRARAMGAAGCERARTGFRWDDVAARVEDLLLATARPT